MYPEFTHFSRAAMLVVSLENGLVVPVQVDRFIFEDLPEFVQDAYGVVSVNETFRTSHLLRCGRALGTLGLAYSPP